MILPRVRHAARRGIATTVVDSSIFARHNTSITIGTDGLPVMSYYDLTNRDLKVARCGSASCGPILRRR